jgi:D-aspartate ligase
MQFIERDFIPVLLSPNLNAYSLAREFYSAYKVKSIVLGKYQVVQTIHSKLIDFRKVGKLEEDTDFLEEMSKLAIEFCITPSQKKKAGMRPKKIILIGCTDTHIKMIMRNKMELKNISENILFNYVDYEVGEKLMNKEEFYKLCEIYNLDYPKTFIFKYEDYLELEKYKKKNLHSPNSLSNKLEPTNLSIEDFSFFANINFPIVLKPSNWTEYAKNKFEGQEKVYVNIKTESEAENILEKIYKSGYTDSFIIQEMVMGDDTAMYTLNAYVNQKSEVEMMSLGHVMLEEYTPLGAGNFAVIINDFKKEINEQVKNFLEKKKFTGFANFDIKYDSRDGKYKFFEINLRQGNSHFFVTNGGNNVAEYFVNDLMYGNAGSLSLNKERLGEVAEKRLFLIVPKLLAIIYVSGFKNKLEVLKLVLIGQHANPLFFWPDFSIKRYFYICRYTFGQYLKYFKYFKKKEF